MQPMSVIAHSKFIYGLMHIVMGYVFAYICVILSKYMVRLGEDIY